MEERPRRTSRLPVVQSPSPTSSPCKRTQSVSGHQQARSGSLADLWKWEPTFLRVAARQVAAGLLPLEVPLPEVDLAGLARRDRKRREKRERVRYRLGSDGAVQRHPADARVGARQGVEGGAQTAGRPSERRLVPVGPLDVTERALRPNCTRTVPSWKRRRRKRKSRRTGRRRSRHHAGWGWHRSWFDVG